VPIPLPASPPAVVQPAPAARPTSTATASKGERGYRLQLAAVRSPERAKEEWERLKRNNSDVLGSLDYVARRVDLGERGIFYRIQAGPVGDAAVAERRCGELKRRGVSCLLVKP
jgi:cell division septation protein DedD